MAKAKRKTLPKDFEALLAGGDIAPLKAVFDGCDVNARGGVFKQTALAFAECPDELTRWLVEHGADLSAGDEYGETPLHARAGHWKGRVELLIELGADVNHSAGGSGTPLHRAADNGNFRAAKALLDHGARADATNQNGQTPLLYALQRCSNIGIEKFVPMAELLLNAAPQPAQKLRSFVSRLTGSSPKTLSPITPEMQEQVTRIGTDFEFHRAGFNQESVAAVSTALEHLYMLFETEPVARRAVHDGKSPIIAKSGRWQDQHQELWELLVPSSGAAATAQGEAIRIAGRINDEMERNGGANWDKHYRLMADALFALVSSGNPLPAPDLDKARDAIADVKRKNGDTSGLCKFAVQWVALNPKPIALSPPEYSR